MKKVTKNVEEHFEHKFDNGFTYHEVRMNDKFKYSYFTRKEKDKNCKKFQYIYSPELKKLAMKMPWGWVEEDKKIPDSIFLCPQIDVDTFNDWENVIYFGGSNDGVTWGILDKTPISTPMIVGYIEGHYTDREYDLVKLEKHLKKDKRVSQLEVVDIPYYNSDCGNKAIEFIVKLSQEEHDRLYKKFKSDEFWMLKIERSVCGSSIHSDVDILGTKQFRKPESIIEAEDKKNYVAMEDEDE